MKSLDYRFSDQNTAVFPKKATTDRAKQKLDAAAYRQKILADRAQGGLRSSEGVMAIDIGELSKQQDVTKSPGFRREKQMDKQRKKEKVEAKLEEGEDHKSSFMQCTFNMANILMVRTLKFFCRDCYWGYCSLDAHNLTPTFNSTGSRHARPTLRLQICWMDRWLLRNPRTLPGHMEDILLHRSRTKR